MLASRIAASHQFDTFNPSLRPFFPAKFNHHVICLQKERRAKKGHTDLKANQICCIKAVKETDSRGEVGRGGMTPLTPVQMYKSQFQVHNYSEDYPPLKNTISGCYRNYHIIFLRNNPRGARPM